MSTDFDSIIDRRFSNSSKWAVVDKNLLPDEAAADPLPMWVADMEFRSPPVVIEALERAVQDGIFGYPFRTESYEEAVCGWQKKRFGWGAKPEWLVQTPGVVTALNLPIQTFSQPASLAMQC